MPLEYDELTPETQQRLAASNPQLAQALAAQAARRPRRAAAPATRSLVPRPYKAPREAEWRAFDAAQARYLAAIAQCNEAYEKRNNQLQVRSVETARIVVALLAVLVLTILALGVLGGSGK